MRKINKITALLGSILFFISSVIPSSGVLAGTTAQDGSFTKTAIEIAEDMGNGINLGNTMEALNTWTQNPGVTDFETAWGQPVTTREMIAGYKEAGFDSVRIPVAWSNMMDTSAYTINEAYFNRVDEIVGYVLDEDMYAIINIHYDGGWWSNFTSDKTGTMNRYETMWQQIATHYKDYSEKLIFESANEELHYDFGYDLINEINQTFVDLVRQSGGNNDKRYLLIAGCNTDIDNTCNDSFKMPTDTISNHLLISVHYYTPWIYCGLHKDEGYGYQSDWGSDADKELMDSYFKKMQKFTNQGYGVIIGEYSVCPEYVNSTTYNRKDGDAKFLAYVLELSDKYGYAPYLWDTGDWYNKSTCKMRWDDVAAVFEKKDSGTTGDVKWKFDIKSGTLTISGTGMMADYTKASETPWYDFRNSVKKLVIEENVTYAGNYCFAYFINLAHVYIYSDDIEVSSKAFFNVTNKPIVYGYGSTAAKTFADSVGYTYRDLNYNIGTSTVTVTPNVRYTGNKVFPTITVVKNGKTLKAWTDYGITYSDNVNTGTCTVKITGRGNYWNSVSKTFTISMTGNCGKNVTWQFNSKTGALTIMGSGAMYSYTSSLNTPWASVKTKIKTLFVGKDVTSIGNTAFYGCTSLTKVTGMAGINKIGENAFRNCTALVSVAGCTKVTAVEKYAFCGDSALTTVGNTSGRVTLMSAKTIGWYSFGLCNSISYVNTGTALTTVSGYAFYNDKALKTIIFRSTQITYVGTDALKGIASGASIYVPASKLNSYKNGILKGKTLKSL